MRISDWSSDVCSSDLVPHTSRLENRLQHQLIKGAVREAFSSKAEGDIAEVRVVEIRAKPAGQAHMSGALQARLLGNLLPESPFSNGLARQSYPHSGTIPARNRKRTRLTSSH